MIDKPLVEKKLRRIEEFLRELRGVEIGTIEEFKENVVTKRFIERNIELAIEQMIDICKHFVSGLDLSEPETYSDCFDILGWMTLELLSKKSGTICSEKSREFSEKFYSSVLLFESNSVWTPSEN